MVWTGHPQKATHADNNWIDLAVWQHAAHYFWWVTCVFMLRGCPSQHWAMFSLIFSLSNTTGQIWFSFLSCPIRNHPFVYSICTCYGLWTTQSETSLLLDKQPEPKPSLRDQRWIELPVCLLFWCTAFSPWLITRSPAVNLLLVRWEEALSSCQHWPQETEPFWKCEEQLWFSLHAKLLISFKKTIFVSC